MAGAAAGAAVVGAGISAYGAIKSAQDQAAIDRDRATVAYLQADELGQREKANEAFRSNRAFQSKLDFGAAVAGSGHAGTGVGSQLEIQRQSDLANLLSARDAEFKIEMLKHGALLSERMAGETETAGYLSAAGTLLGAAGRAGSTYSGGYAGKESAESLPPPSFTGG